MSEDRLKDAVAREMLTVMTLPGVPPTVLLDCDLKRKYHSDNGLRILKNGAEPLSQSRPVKPEVLLCSLSLACRNQQSGSSRNRAMSGQGSLSGGAPRYRPPFRTNWKEPITHAP